jgi:hypothetical protein
LIACSSGAPYLSFKKNKEKIKLHKTVVEENKNKSVLWPISWRCKDQRVEDRFLCLVDCRLPFPLFSICCWTKLELFLGWFVRLIFWAAIIKKKNTSMEIKKEKNIIPVQTFHAI